MSRQDKLDLPDSGSVPPAHLDDDDRLQIDVRLGLAQVAAVEEERLRSLPRRRPTRPQLARLAQHLYNARRERSEVFKTELFGEPAWDMLLALYFMPKRGEVLYVSSLSDAAEVPPTTGLRWQKTLMEEGLIRRGPHIADRRLQLVGLTQQGRLLVEQYLTKLFYCHGGLPETE